VVIYLEVRLNMLQGISINENTWRLLGYLGAAKEIEQVSNRGDGTKVDMEQR
jgi:salicylate hydroxylase